MSGDAPGRSLTQCQHAYSAFDQPQPSIHLPGQLGREPLQVSCQNQSHLVLTSSWGVHSHGRARVNLNEPCPQVCVQDKVSPIELKGTRAGFDHILHTLQSHVQHMLHPLVHRLPGFRFALCREDQLVEIEVIYLSFKVFLELVTGPHLSFGEP